MSSNPNAELPSDATLPALDDGPDAPDEQLGEVLAGRYRLVRLLGEGGMGRVYLAEHVKIGKRYAVKVLADDRAVPRAADRFLREAQATAAIGHQNIVDIVDYGETRSGGMFLVMEFLEGEDLGATIEREGALPWPRVRKLVVQICRALEAAHEKGIIHRDMKPENCFRTRRGDDEDFIKVLDFGIAKLTGAADKKRTRLTRTGNIFGTPEYMSPEQARSIAVDHRADIYAVGVIMYELLTGDVPFSGDTFMGVLLQHINDPVVPPSQKRRELEIPAEIDAIVLEALAKDREERYGHIGDLADALLAVEGGEGVDLSTLSPVYARRLPRRSAHATEASEDDLAEDSLEDDETIVRDRPRSPTQPDDEQSWPRGRATRRTLGRLPKQDGPPQPVSTLVPDSGPVPPASGPMAIVASGPVTADSGPTAAGSGPQAAVPPSGMVHTEPAAEVVSRPHRAGSAAAKSSRVRDIEALGRAEGSSRATWAMLAVALLVGAAGGGIAYFASGSGPSDTEPQTEARAEPEVVDTPVSPDENAEVADEEGESTDAEPEPVDAGVEDGETARSPGSAQASSRPLRPRGERRRDGLGKRAIAKAVRKLRPALGSCVGQATGGRFGDRVTIEFVVDGSDGRVKSARARGEHANTAVGDCVADVAKRAEFPTFSGTKKFRRTVQL